MAASSPEPGDEVPLQRGHPAVEQRVVAQPGRVRRPVGLARHEVGRGAAGVVPARPQLGLLGRNSRNSQWISFFPRNQIMFTFAFWLTF